MNMSDSSDHHHRKDNTDEHLRLGGAPAGVAIRGNGGSTVAGEIEMMPGPEQVEYSKELLDQFKLDYLHHGKFNLGAQIPHLANLAEFYEKKYATSRNWTDCVKAHALYNSISSREPQSDGWRKKAFEMQQQYWEDDSSCEYPQQQLLTDSLKQDLEARRNQIRDDMKSVEAVANDFDGSDEVAENFLFNRMKDISVACSDQMSNFAGQIIGESINIFKPSKPPCDFVAVAIGSIARGEGTPYSDLEYLFLVEESSPETVTYFERLAIMTYFQIGNLGETKLAYMAIKELDGWFSDTAKNGFKIDGLSEKAGNIPTGNGSSCLRNHFIVTPNELAERYRNTLDNPVRDQALRGDMTAMLTYMKPLFTHQTVRRDLLMELKTQIAAFTINQERNTTNCEMLNTDIAKFNFKPSSELMDKGFAADVKREIYRFPSILLLDIAILTRTTAINSWESIKALHDNKQISDHLHSTLQLTMAAATYIRLSAYLFHDSQDDRMSVAHALYGHVQITPPQFPNSLSQRRWFVPIWLFISMCFRTDLLRQKLTGSSNLLAQDLKTIVLDEDNIWSRIAILYYTARYSETLATLHEIYGASLWDNLLSVTQNLPTSHSELEVLTIISQTLFFCDKFRAALVLYKHMTDKNICDMRVRIADCYTHLGVYDEAVTVLESVTEKSALAHISLGNAYHGKKEYKKSEQSFVQAFELDHVNISAEKQYDYYGDPINIDHPTVTAIQNISFATMTTAKQRLTQIFHSSPVMIMCVGSLARVYRHQEQYNLANLYYQKTLHLISELYGDGAAVRFAAKTLNNLGVNYAKMGLYYAAADCFNQAVAIYRKTSDGRETDEIARAQENLGIIYKYSGDGRILPPNDLRQVVGSIRIKK